MTSINPPSASPHFSGAEPADFFVYHLLYYPNSSRVEITDIDGDIKPITGVTADQLNGTSAATLSGLIHEDDRDDWWSFLENVSRSRSFATKRYRINNQETGEVHWVEDRMVFSEALPEGSVHLTGFIVDLNHRLQTPGDNRNKAQSHIDTEKLYAVINQTVGSIVIADAGGTIQFANPMFTLLTGYDQDEVLGKNLDLVCDNKKSACNQMWKALNAGKVWTSRLIKRHKLGTEYWEEVSISPIRDEQDDRVHYVAIGRDITQEVSMEERLRQSQKLEAVGQLASGIAHEFNNILTGIIGYADLGLAELRDDHKLRKTLKAIIHKSDDAATLIRQLLAFSRKQILDIRVMDLNQIIRQSSDFLNRVLKDNIKLSTVLAEEECIIEADIHAIQQILANLCVNAQDAMEDGGSLEIVTKLVTLDEEYCKNQTELEPGQYGRITVKDSGTGMDEEILEHLFEPFFTTKEVGKGTGLGLATVYGLVKQHQGYIDLSSVTGKKSGTSFDIYFPTVMEEKDNTDSRIGGTLLGGMETILFVEDDVEVLYVMENILTHAGYTVLTAKNGAMGLQRLEDNPGKIDLVISDIYMPEKSGLELYQETRKQGLQSRFVFITGYPPGDILDNLEDDCRLLQKPVSSRELTKTIRELLEGE